jgi:dihydroorotase
MSMLVIRGGRVVTPDRTMVHDVLCVDGKIAPGGTIARPDARTIDATGKLVFAGVIDTQVHFREPGLEHKEDLGTGSLAAVAGGVTTFFEMPNTQPNTVSPKELADKLSRARGRVRADHAFFLGATARNAERLAEWERLPGCAGIKVFMGSSTGSLLVGDDATLERVLRHGKHRVPVHAEDEPRLRERYAAVTRGSPVRIHPDVRDVETALKATTRLLALAEKTQRPVHVLHVSTAEEIALLRERDLKPLVTAEATPNHLFLCAPECYDRFGSLAQMNPPVRDRRHRDAIREAVADGTIDVIGSDHAPHAREEKERPYPDCPSGIPGVQTTLPLLLTAVRDGWLTLEDVARLTSAGPARIYGVEAKGALEPGCDADLVIVDPEITEPLPLAWLRSKTGYSPFEGTPLAGWPVTTIVRGEIVYHAHEPQGTPQGRPAVLRS